ncbi:MAG: hypothetical protein QOK21_1812, partial [Solirubrobacteraceae bacterium]|nr:hypothetical protein [Solirubrobacteraceae bacterium]
AAQGTAGATDVVAPTDTSTPDPGATPTDTPVATPTDTPVATPTDTPVATPTDTPTDTPVATPTDTPVATPTDTPVPTATPSPTPLPVGTHFTVPPSPAPTSTAAPAPTGAVRGTSGSRRILRPFPVVRIKGFLTADGAHLSLLTVRAPARARISVLCSGSGCPRRNWGHAVSLVHVRPFQRVLRAGVTLTIRVTRRRYIGKYTQIVVRRGRPPSRRDACLFSSSPRPRRCPRSTT